MHHVIMQAPDGPDLQTILQSMRALGVTRVIFPPREYRHKATTGNARKSQYDTARLLPRGGDDGFAERFLNSRRRRDT